MLDLADVASSTTLDRPDLKYEPWVPFTQRRLASPKDGDLFAEIASRDIVVQHPYDSFATSVEAFVRAAATTRRSSTLKTTVYRTSHDSALAPALIEAAENGKQSVCVVELKARFDERRNIEWARALEQAGVHVVYGFPDMKIHAKTTLVVRREGDELRRYVHIGTGNYHATTARIYEDVGLFTADPDIAADVADLFNFVTGFGRPQEFRKLLVAPFNLETAPSSTSERSPRPRRPASAPRSGSRSNNLTAPDVIEELYKASAGRRADRHHRPRRLHARPRRPGPERANPRPLDPRPLPRAQPPLLLRGRRPEDVPARQRRPDAAQPRPPDRGRRPGRGHARPQRARGDLQDAPRRQHPGLGAARRRHLAARHRQKNERRRSAQATFMRRRDRARWLARAAEG